MSKTVFTNGCFDVLHPGHIELFKVGRSLGDKLIVAIDSDQKVKRDKGPQRPINNVQFRKTMLESIKYIDLVLTFDSREELEQLIELYAPDTLLIGADWRGRDVVGGMYAKEVKFFNRVGDYSTTRILQDIVDR
jgi:D-beta-D-heptose 7-phosphate kinase/D-beta-D-heptose 1-phosphate adenosyltransferase